MVSALDRKLLRDLMRLRGQVVTIALVMACGIATYVCLRSTWASLGSSKAAYYERYRFADVFARLERAPEPVAERIEAIPGVARVHTRVVQDVLLPLPGRTEPATGRLISIPAHGEAPLDAVYLRTGRMPEAGRADEAVVLEGFARAHDLVPGSTLPVVIAGKRRTLRVVGVALSPEYVFAAQPGDMAPDDARFAVLWMDRAVLAPAFQMEGAFNDVTLRLQPGASEPAVLAALDRLLAPYGGLDAVPRARQTSSFMLEGELAQLEQMATALPFIFLAVAAFLVNVVLSRLISLQRQQIAVLKALGYGNRRIGLHYLELVSLIAALGCVVGVASGAWLGQALTSVYTRFFRFPDLTYRLDAGVVAVAVLVSLAAAAAGALIAVRQVIRMPPAEAMRPPAPAVYHRSLFERLGLHRLLGPPAMMVLRELRRRPGRMLLSSLGIAAAVGIMVVGRFTYDAFDHLIEGIMHESRRSDMTVAFMQPLPARAERSLAHLPGVLATEGTRMMPVRFRVGHRWRDSVVNGMADQPALYRVVDRDAREVEIPAHGLAMSEKLAEILHIGIGDPVEIEVREGARQTHVLPVTRLVDDAFGVQGYMRMSSLHHLLGQEPRVSMVELRVDPDQADELQRRLVQMPGLAQVIRQDRVVERFRAQAGESMLVMTIVLTFFGVIIAIGVVYNNARVALSMRSRDLASLRVLGFTRAEISAVLLGEMAVQIAAAIPLGLLMGNAWAHAIMAGVDPEAYRLPLIISARTYAFAVIVVVGAGMVSALLVRRKLDHLDLIGVLKTRE